MSNNIITLYYTKSNYQYDFPNKPLGDDKIKIIFNFVITIQPPGNFYKGETSFEA